MLSHLSLGVEDLARAAAFYETVLAPLGFVCVWRKPRGAGFGAPDGEDRLALFPAPDAAGGSKAGFHLCFAAPSRDAVDAFHAAALAAGGKDAGAPGLRPHYGADYYAAFAIDLDGHKLEAKVENPSH
jgi:catechol 2,3-dioxygenase-like lactoylglutathione lyase family enzyme